MPIYSLTHCLFCYKNVNEDNNDNEADKNNPPNTINQNSEICKRFCTVASRYYDLDPNYFGPHKTLRSRGMFHSDRACGGCAKILKSFSDIYSHWVYLQMQLDWRGRELGEIMENADKEDSVNAENKQMLMAKLESMELSMEDINGFRNELKQQISFFKKNSYPEIKLARREKENDYDSSSDSDTFVKVNVVEDAPPSPNKRKKVGRRGRKRKTESSITLTNDNNSFSPDTETEVQTTPNKRRRGRPRKRNQSCSSDISIASSNSSCFIPIGKVNLKKKPEISEMDELNSSAIEAAVRAVEDPNIIEEIDLSSPPPGVVVELDETDDDEEYNDSFEYVGATTTAAEADPAILKDSIQNRANYNNNNLIFNVDQTSDFNSSNNKQTNEEETIDIEMENQQQKDYNNIYSSEDQLHIEPDPSGSEILKLVDLVVRKPEIKDTTNEINIAKKSNNNSKSHILAGPLNEARIKYSCSFPTCDRTFISMTRFVIHQHKSGHLWHAVVTINKK